MQINEHVKTAIMQLDDELLSVLIEAAYFSLKDLRTIARVTKVLPLTIFELEALAALAGEITNANGETISIKSVIELKQSACKLAGLYGISDLRMNKVP